jgi:hypothetical protein
VYEAQAYLAQLDQTDVHAGKDSGVRMMRGLYSDSEANSKRKRDGQR